MRAPEGLLVGSVHCTHALVRVMTHCRQTVHALLRGAWNPTCSRATSLSSSWARLVLSLARSAACLDRRRASRGLRGGGRLRRIVARVARVDPARFTVDCIAACGSRPPARQTNPIAHRVAARHGVVALPQGAVELRAQAVPLLLCCSTRLHRGVAHPPRSVALSADGFALLLCCRPPCTCCVAGLDGVIALPHGAVALRPQVVTLRRWVRSPTRSSRSARRLLRSNTTLSCWPTR